MFPGFSCLIDFIFELFFALGREVFVLVLQAINELFCLLNIPQPIRVSHGPLGGCDVFLGFVAILVSLVKGSLIQSQLLLTLLRAQGALGVLAIGIKGGQCGGFLRRQGVRLLDAQFFKIGLELEIFP